VSSSGRCSQVEEVELDAGAVVGGVDVVGSWVVLDDGVVVEEPVVEVVLDGSMVLVDWSGPVVVVVSTVELVEESTGAVVVGFVSTESCEDSDDVVSELSPESDFEVWACPLAGSREPMPPLLLASSSFRVRLSGSAAVEASSSAGATATEVDGSGAWTALMARGAATASAVTVDSERASRKRVRPDESRC
jgi:hypothetical protein